MLTKNFSLNLIEKEVLHLLVEGRIHDKELECLVDFCVSSWSATCVDVAIDVKSTCLGLGVLLIAGFDILE